MLTAAGRTAYHVASRWPWTNVYGLARTLAALSTLGTLVFSSPSSLFRPVAGIPGYPNCRSLSAFSVYCVFPGDGVQIGWYVSIAILIVAAVGWRPRYTAIPHWWVTFSFQVAASIPDGGDQIASNLLLLIIPVALLDNRTWHWQAPLPDAVPANQSILANQSMATLQKSLIAWSALFAIRLQVAGVYLHASVAKLGVAEWVDGSALYYWLTDAEFGAPRWTHSWLGAVLQLPVGVQMLTWGSIAIEFALFLGIIACRPVRPYLLAAGISLHAAIGLLMGLPSFSFAMFAALVLYLRPTDLHISWLDRLTTHVTSDADPLGQHWGSRCSGRAVTR